MAQLNGSVEGCLGVAGFAEGFPHGILSLDYKGNVVDLLHCKHYRCIYLYIYI